MHYLPCPRKNVEIGVTRLRQTSVSSNPEDDGISCIRFRDSASAPLSGWSNFELASGLRTSRWLKGRGWLCAAGESFGVETAREKVSWSPVIKAWRPGEERSSGSFWLLPAFPDRRWQNWILVKAPSRFADRHRHFGVVPRKRTQIPSFLSTNLNYISLRTFVDCVGIPANYLSHGKRGRVCVTRLPPEISNCERNEQVSG